MVIADGVAVSHVPSQETPSLFSVKPVRHEQTRDDIVLVHICSHPPLSTLQLSISADRWTY